MRRDRLCKHLQNDNIISVYFRMKAERQQKQPFIAKHCKMQGNSSKMQGTSNEQAAGICKHLWHLQTSKEISKTNGNIWKHLQNYATICEHLQKSAKQICKHQETFGKFCKHLQKSTNICKHLQKYAKIYKHVQNNNENLRKTSKYNKMLGKWMELVAKRRLGQGMAGSFLGRPGGMRGGRILRFAEADKASASAG